MKRHKIHEDNSLGQFFANIRCARRKVVKGGRMKLIQKGDKYRSLTSSHFLEISHAILFSDFRTDECMHTVPSESKTYDVLK